MKPGRLAGISGEPEMLLPPKKKINYLDLLVEGAEGTVQRTAWHELPAGCT